MPAEGSAPRCVALAAEAGRPAAGSGRAALRTDRGQHPPARPGAAPLFLSGGAESGKRRWRRDGGLGSGGALRAVLRPGAGLRRHRRGLRRLRQVGRGDQLLPDRGGRRRPSAPLSRPRPGEAPAAPFALRPQGLGLAARRDPSPCAPAAARGGCGRGQSSVDVGLIERARD